MAKSFVEKSDRWIFQMREYVVSAILIEDDLTLTLTPPGQIKVGLDALLTKGPLHGPNTIAKRIREYGQFSLNPLIGAHLLSTVGFKTGDLRVVFEGGWHLNVSSDYEFVAASVASDALFLWKRAELGTVQAGPTGEQ
jgi:hypothetical protein